MFFATSMFYLSGAINVLLFLIVRPNLLLFSRRTELDTELDMELDIVEEPLMQLSHQDTQR
jgi:hypothetical protein